MIFAISIPFAALNQILISIFIGFKKLEYMVYTDRILSNFFKLTFIIIFGLLGFGIIGLAMGNTLGVFFTFLISIYFLEKRVFSIRNAIKPIFLKRKLYFFLHH